MKTWCLVAFLALLATAGLARADERILAYDSTVQVHADGRVDVEERIRVRAEGQDIRRGIYRDFPTRYRDARGNRVRVGFEVVEVLRDGRPEPFFTERVNNGVRVNTGNDDLLPTPAELTWTLRFRTTRQVGFFGDHDELYWNAIGHGWTFPIDAGSVEVRLPAPVPVDAMTAVGYTGVTGARDREVAATVVAPGIARWTLTAPLGRDAGMTLVLSFPKGVVTPPGDAQTRTWFLLDNLGALVGLSFLALLLAVCGVRWHQVGRDPRAGTVVVRYEPPAGWSPGELRTMMRMGVDARAFSADLLSAAVDGAVILRREPRRILGDLWTLVPTTTEAITRLGGARRILLRAIFAKGLDEVQLKSDDAETLRKAREKHTRAITDRLSPSHYRWNGGSIAFAVGLTFLGMLSTIVTLAFTGGGGVAVALAAIVAMIATCIAFAFLVRAPSPEGRRLLDGIEGLRRYLGVAEKPDLARLQPPDAAAPSLDAARFERLLPYAVALDVEDAWTARFTAAVGAATAAAATASVAWFHGGGFGDAGSLTNAIGGSLTSSIASSSAPPGSSSGGGGGGFSGGGGGGGGGGGR